jgi:hypothetical protein
MQATGEDLHGAIFALSLLVGVMLASDPRREELIQDYKRSLHLLDSDPEWRDVAVRAKEYARSMFECLHSMDRTRSN